MIQELTVQELDELLAEGAVLIDVREDDEVEAGAIDGMQHMPLSRFDEFSDEIGAIESPIVFYCRSGKRSMSAAKLAEEWTDQDLYSLDGGYTAYQENL